MRLNAKIQNLSLEFICLLYILLFVYAAVSKLLDFENFQVQLGQSPLLSAFASLVSILIPAVELVICVFIIIPKFRAIGLFASYGLMVMFTAYIFTVLHYTSFVPCSCGGVLEKLNWTQHLIFNSVFVILAIFGIVFYFSEKKATTCSVRSKTILVLFCSITFFSIALVAGLFLMSENIIHYHNKLTRRFPHTPAKIRADLDLKLNSFYIAGAANDKIYLGNATAPLLITVLDTNLRQTLKKNVNLDRKDLPFQAVKVIVHGHYFFVLDGRIPCLYRGDTNNWKAKLVKIGGEYFTTAQAMDSSIIAVRTHSSKNGEAIMGIINLADTTKTALNPQILQKQFDGVFDTDGQLLYSTGLQRFIFLYAYRNQFTVFDSHLRIDFRGNTIDTISHAKLSIVKVKKHHFRKFSKPPLYVNKSSATYSNLLFVNSAIPGKYEQDALWEKASIIDVYNLIDNSYLLSFCIYDIGGKKMRSFVVNNTKLYALIGNNIVSYHLDQRITSNYKK
jgi:uncharacterized membrane protein YphA (DoxX/SURF4 family)